LPFVICGTRRHSDEVPTPKVQMTNDKIRPQGF
jgi:hypothetical protein